MNKPFDYKEVDDGRRCMNCNKPIKRNVLARIANVVRCYYCFLLEKGFTISGTKSVRSKVLLNKKNYRQ